MSEVYLEAFSRPKALLQARQVSGLVRHELELEQSWLRQAFPETARRHRDILHSTKSIGRLAATSGFKAFIVREGDKQGEIHGLATLIPFQTVTVPGAGEGAMQSGNDIDYWLKMSDEGDRKLHVATARELILASARYDNRYREMPHSGKTQIEEHDTLDEYNGSVTTRVIASIRDGQPNPPLGIEALLEPIGSPGALESLSRVDHGVTKGGAVVQLYFGQQTFTSDQL